MNMENNENNVSTQNTENTQANEKNYKQEYEKQLVEIEKLKNAISKTNSENAEYRRKAEAQMTEEEKKQKEWQEVLERNKQMSKQIEQMQLEKDLLANGFNSEESAKLIDGKFGVKIIADIIKTRVEAAVKSAKAEFTKGTTAQSLVGKGTTTETSDFQAYQANKNAKNNIVELK